jgi:hypothetical protein
MKDLLYFDGENTIITPIERRGLATGEFRVVSIGLDGEGVKKHLFLVNGFLSHNLKDPNDL